MGKNVQCSPPLYALIRKAQVVTCAQSALRLGMVTADNANPESLVREIMFYVNKSLPRILAPFGASSKRGVFLAGYDQKGVNMIWSVGAIWTLTPAIVPVGTYPLRFTNDRRGEC